MKSEIPADEHWSDCPPGELSNLVSRLRGQRRKHLIIKNGVVAGIVCLVTVVDFSIQQGMLSSSPHGQYAELLNGDGQTYGKICCQKVKHFGADYLAGDVDPEIKHRIDSHLKECKSCHSLYERMRHSMQNSGIMLPLRNIVQLQGIQFLIANTLPSN